jgi:hypothetical protein
MIKNGFKSHPPQPLNLLMYGRNEAVLGKDMAKPIANKR